MGGGGERIWEGGFQLKCTLPLCGLAHHPPPIISSQARHDAFKEWMSTVDLETLRALGFDPTGIADQDSAQIAAAITVRKHLL